jgi:hypothetical protein
MKTNGILKSFFPQKKFKNIWQSEKISSNSDV